MATFTKEDGTIRKNLYHSDLAGLGPTTIVLKSAPKPSKYAGKPPYVRLQVAADETVYTLGIDNQNVQQVLAGLPIGTPVQVQAAGRDEAATLQVFGAGAPLPAAAPAAASPQAAPPASAGPPPGYPGGPAVAGPQGNGGNGQPARTANGRPLSHSYWECAETAVRIVDKLCADHEKVPTDDAWLEAVHSIATHMHIDYQNSGGRKAIRK